VSIYGEGNVRSPHFLGPELSLIELWRQHRAILCAHDITKLVETGQLVYDEHSALVEPPKKIEAAVAAKKAAKKRSKKR